MRTFSIDEMANLNVCNDENACAQVYIHSNTGRTSSSHSSINKAAELQYPNEYVCIAYLRIQCHQSNIQCSSRNIVVSYFGLRVL